MAEEADNYIEAETRSHIMEQELQPFTRHGTEKEPIKVSADEILEAIAEE